MKRLLCIFLYSALLLTPLCSSARGTWTNYTTTKYKTDIKVQDNSLWYSTTGGIVCWNISEKTYEKYTMDDGLPSNEVHSIAIEEDGVVWTGVRGGYICRFNGEKWETIVELDGSINNWATFIEFDSDGVIWAGTYNSGLFLIEGDSITNFTAENGLVGRIVSVAFDSDDAVWVGTSVGLYRYDGEKFHAYTSWDVLFDDGIRSMTFDPDNNIWVGTNDGLAYFDGSTWTMHLKENYDITLIRSTEVDSDGDVWAHYEGMTRQDSGSLISSHYIARYDGESWIDYTQDSGLAGNKIFEITTDADGGLWVASSNEIVRFNGDSWESFKEKEGLAGNEIYSLAVESDGTVWAGTYSEGVSRLKKDTWTTYTQENVLMENYVRKIKIGPDNTVWLTNGSGVTWYDGTKWESYDFQAVLPSYHNYVCSVAFAPDGAVWLYTKGETSGVYCYDNETWINYTEDDGLANNDVSSIAVDSCGVVWLGIYEGGISRYDGETWTTYTTDDGLAENKIGTIAFTSDGTLWAATYNEGVSRFDGQSWTTVTTEDGLLSNEILDLMTDSQGGVWVVTREGLSHYNGKKWTIYTEENGFAGERIRKSAIGPDDTVWVAGYNQIHGQGISRFDGETWKTFTVEDGLVSNYVCSIAFGPDGDVWFGTYNGISRFDQIITDVKELETIPQKTTITGIFPNPFNAGTTIRFSLPFQSYTGLVIYNIVGQKVRVLVSGRLTAGSHFVAWDGCDDYGNPVSSGVFFISLNAGAFSETKKMMLIR